MLVIGYYKIVKVQEAEIKKAKVAELERLIAAKIDDLEVLLKV